MQIVAMVTTGGCVVIADVNDTAINFALHTQYELYTLSKTHLC